MPNQANKRTVVIHKTDTDKDDVVVGVNGKLIQIQRGKPVELEEHFIEALKHAKIETIVKDPDTGDETAVTIPRFAVDVE